MGGGASVLSKRMSPDTLTSLLSLRDRKKAGVLGSRSYVEKVYRRMTHVIAFEGSR